MKHLKTFEDNTQQYPKVGDYIILDKFEMSAIFKPEDILYKWQNFLKNTIGKIDKIYYSMDNEKQITIKYNTKDVPRELQNTYLDKMNFVNVNGKRIDIFQRTFNYNNIEKYFTCSNNIEDLNLILTTNKYNL